MLETVREYGRSVLESGPFLTSTMEHLVLWIQDNALAFSEKQNGSLEEAAEMMRLEREFGNIRAVLDWWVEHSDPGDFLETLNLLERFLVQRGKQIDAIRWLEQMQDRAPISPVRIQALNARGKLHRDAGRCRVRRCSATSRR